MSFNWTPQATEALKTLAAEGFSAKRIAEELGCPTRASVIGKAHRLGVDLTYKVPTGKPRIKRSPEFRLKRRTAERAAIMREVPEPDALRLPIQDLASSQCRWCVTADSPFLFCGQPTEQGMPYCSHHCGIAYVPPQARIREPRPR